MQSMVREYHGNMKSMYNNSFVIFLLDISMDIYEGQITAILGHNASGKTTLFNLLTGMIAPSKGFASIFGFDVRYSVFCII